MASGFIYLIILAMWVAYFLPRWITSHEEASGKSAERYKSAMRVVGENGVQVSAPIDTFNNSEKKINKQQQIAQRRMVYSALAIFFLITLLGVAINFISLTILSIPVSAIAIYTVHVRRQVVAAQMRARRLKALQQITTAKVITEPIEKITLSARLDFQEANTEHWIPLSERSESTGVVVIPKDANTWQPTSVPKPTYASAPKAVTPKRVIDLTVPGAWSAEQELKAALPETTEDFFDQVLAEEAAQERWGAVNE
jgi:hypothetical protein